VAIGRMFNCYELCNCFVNRLIFEELMKVMRIVWNQKLIVMFARTHSLSSLALQSM